MAVKMRLRRMGSRNAPFYRVVVQDSRRATTGRFIETIGWYDPKQEGENFSINLDRVEYWTSSGAQPSDTVSSLIKKARTLPVEKAASGQITEEEVPQEQVETEIISNEADDEISKDPEVEDVTDQPDSNKVTESEEAVDQDLAEESKDA
jgi:small subunit ribosomal protein S16